MSTEKLEQQIAEEAYRIWETEGRPDGHDMEHWLRAESALQTSDDAHAGEPAPDAVQKDNMQTNAAAATAQYLEADA